MRILRAKNAPSIKIGMKLGWSYLIPVEHGFYTCNDNGDEVEHMVGRCAWASGLESDGRIFPMRCSFQSAPVKVIRCVERDADAFFGEQQIGDFLPRFVLSSLLVDEIKVRFQDAVERFAAAFSLCRIGHQRTE